MSFDFENHGPPHLKLWSEIKGILLNVKLTQRKLIKNIDDDSFLFMFKSAIDYLLLDCLAVVQFAEDLYKIKLGQYVVKVLEARNNHKKAVYL